MIRSKYSSLAGMVIALILFIGIDKWLYWQERTARQNSNFELYYLWVIVSGEARPNTPLSSTKCVSPN